MRNAGRHQAAAKRAGGRRGDAAKQSTTTVIGHCTILPENDFASSTNNSRSRSVAPTIISLGFAVNR
jgi:hypothetical protein